jgi:glycerophosphoryl diester phosphodiesterase
VYRHGLPADRGGHRGAHRRGRLSILKNADPERKQAAARYIAYLAQEEPENSVESFRLAEQAGVDEIELDVRLTADGVAIVLHDATLDRVAADESGRDLGPVAELTLEQIRGVVLDSGRPVLTFEEALDETTVDLQVEIKAVEVVPEVARIVLSRPADAGRTRFTSFQPEALYLLARHAPDVPRGLITTGYPATDRHPDGIEAVLAATGCSTFYCGWDGLTADLVQRMRDGGYAMHGWPLRTAEDVQRALDLGLGGGTADDPRIARAWLQDAHAGRLNGG